MQAFTRRQLAEVIGEKTLHLKNRQELTDSIAAYLVSSPSAVDLDLLMRDVMQYRLEQGFVEAIAVSAYPIDGKMLGDIEQLLREKFPEARSITIGSRIDRSLVGGVRIELPQENLDLSIRSKLNTFKRLVADERN